jgi:hypothetical protein
MTTDLPMFTVALSIPRGGSLMDRTGSEAGAFTFALWT